MYVSVYQYIGTCVSCVCLSVCMRYQIRALAKTMSSGYEISYFGNNALSLLQFKPGSNDSKNLSELFSSSKKTRII